MDRELLCRHLERIREMGISELFYSPTSPEDKKATSPSEREPIEEGKRVPQAPAVSEAESDHPLDEINRVIRSCTRCKLSEGRMNAVPGEGDYNARLVFVGEAPGAEEDRLGKPFVGRAGKLLDRMIDALGLKRSQVFIGNVLKCRPPDNRDPEPDEVEACSPYLDQQLDIIDPLVIVALGKFAAQYLTGSTLAIGKLRGQEIKRGNAVIIPTYHTAACLRFPDYKKPVWEDLRKALQIIRERERKS